jgi:3-carboxy-cis,cis-muconate cycloisomerase
MASSRLLASLATTNELADLFSDQSVLTAFLQFESALSRVQAQLGLIPPSAADAIFRSAAPTHFDAETISREARISATIAIPLVKAQSARVAAIDPVAGRFVHWGATSQDVIDSVMSLLLRRAKGILTRDHTRLAQSLRALSDAHAKTVMLGRTVLQPAPPITFGYKVAGWYGGVDRSWRRLETSFSDAVTLQFGGAVGTLAAYGRQGMALAAALAKELNLPLADAPWHAHRDRMGALVADCGVYTAALGKIARDVSLLMQPEVGEVSEAGGGSSTMPNKRNPAGSVLALAAAMRLPGLVAAFLAGMVQEHERAAGGFQAEWPIVSDVIETSGSALAGMVAAIDGLTVYPDRMRANLEATRGVIFAEKARMLVQPELGREAAENLLSEAAREALETGRPFRQVLRDRPEICSLLTAQQLDNIDCPEDYLGAAEEFRKRLMKD